MRSEGYSSRFVCVFVSPIEILRMAALSIELSHVLCIKSNYLQSGRVVCRKTLSFLRYSQNCSYERFGLHGHAYKIVTTPIFISVVCSRDYPRFSCPGSRVCVCLFVVFCHLARLDT